MQTVLKFHFDRACFHSREATTDFGVVSASLTMIGLQRVAGLYLDESMGV